ncbi:hypothetical protein Tco_1047673, partial [Tanacetum coccineum]
MAPLPPRDQRHLWHLKRYASKRKRGARMFVGQFISRLAGHFRLLTEERL